jgi:hypothetical protein
MKKSPLFYLTGAWLVLLPWHAFLKTWLSSLFLGSNADYLPTLSNILSTWKEGLLLVLLIGSLWQARKSNWQLWLKQPSTIILGLYIMSLVIFGTLHTPDWKTWLLALRTDLLFVPSLIFGIACQFIFDTEQKKQLLKWTCYSLLIATSIGIVAWMFAPDIGLHFGYSPYESSYVENKPLPIYHCLFIQDHCIPRLQATFSGPNQAGALMALLLGLMAIVFQFSWWLLIPLFALIITFSRSALIGVIIASIYWIPRKWLWKSGLIAVILLVAILFWKPDLITHGLSSVEHWDKTNAGIEHIIQEPLGSGLGTAGPVSRRVFGEEKALISENWYLQIGEEAGIFSLLLLLLYTGWLIKDYLHQPDRQTALIGGVLLALSIQALFLHLWEDSMVTILVWFWVGQSIIQAKKT